MNSIVYIAVLAQILNAAFIAQCQLLTVELILVIRCVSLFDAWRYNRTICLCMCIYIHFVFGSAFILEFGFELYLVRLDVNFLFSNNDDKYRRFKTYLRYF